MTSKKVTFLNKLSFGSLLATFFISIFFFIPHLPLSLEVVKGFLISIGILFSLLFWLVARLIDGKFIVPHDRLILFAFFLPVVFLVSSFYSSSPYISLFGGGFEVGTFGSMFLLFIVMFLSSIYFQTEKRLYLFFGALFSGAFILGIFTLLHIGKSYSNLFGNWTDFALFFGLIIVLSLITLEFLKIKKVFQWLLYLLVLMSLFFLVLTNVTFIWILVGIFSLIIFVYSISFQQVRLQESHEIKKEKKLPVMAFVVILVCLLFLIANSSISPFISRYFGFSNIDPRPSVSVTYDIALHSLKQNPILGTGPSTFGMNWNLWKPSSVNQTEYWNTTFSNGFGTIPTFFITTGLVGILVWLLFLIIFFFRGIQSLRVALKNRLSNYFIITSFMLATYAWISLIIYTPNMVMVMLAFATSGIFLGVLVQRKALPLYDFSFLNDPRKSFFSILVVVLLMVSAVSATYIYIEKFTSIVYFAKSQSGDNTPQSLSHKEQMLLKALALDKNDIFYRSLSQVYIAEIGSVLSDKSITEDKQKSLAQSLVDQAESAGGFAITQNRNDYLNWMNLGNVYANLTYLNVSGSYENAVDAYSQAQKLSPTNPMLLLARAELEALHKNADGARDFANQALKMKPDYSDLSLFLNQLDQSLATPAPVVKPNSALPTKTKRK